MSEQKEQGLKPCPFCGNDGSGPIEEALHVCHSEYDWRQDGYTIQCDKCTATIGDSDTEEEAIEAWNRRSPALEAQAAENAELRAEVDNCLALLEAAARCIGTEEARALAAETALATAREDVLEVVRVWEIDRQGRDLSWRNHMDAAIRALKTKEPSHG